MIGCTAYGQGIIMNMAIKVESVGPEYYVTFISSRHTAGTGVVEGVQRITGHTATYAAGKLGIFVYAHTATFDNFQVTDISAGVDGYCEGAGVCDMFTGVCACSLAGAAETMPDCSRGVAADGTVVRAPRYAAAATLVGDINGDCAVDVSDLLLLLAAFGGGAGGDCNGDGATDVADLLLLLAGFGSSCAGGR